jgi:RNA polymerase sigma factor (sigma-70 family)
MSRQLSGARQYLRSLIGFPHNDEGPDGQLLERYVRWRDERAFTNLVQRYGPLVYGVCARVLQNADDAEDAFQATFLVLARKADSLDRRGPLGNWLYTVAFRTAIKARAAIARRRLQETHALEMPMPGPNRDLEWEELRPVLDEELNQLPAKYRVVLVLCYLEGKTHQEAARQLGWPSGSLSRRMNRARELLRRRLTRRGIALSSVLLFGLLSREAVAASVSSTLVATTARAAVYFGAGRLAAHLGASTKAITLAEEVLGSLGRFKWAGAWSLLLYFCLVVTGGVTVSVGARAAVAMMPGWGAHCGSGSAPLAPQQPKTKEIASVTVGPEQIHTLALAPAGSWLAVAGQGGYQRVQVWDLDQEYSPENQRKGPVTLPAVGVQALAFSADGTLLASGGADGRVEVWTMATSKSPRRWAVRSHPGGVSAVSFGPDGKLLASAGADGLVHFWDTSSGKERVALAGHAGAVWSLAFSPDGKLLATGGDDHVIRIWDVATHRERTALDGHTDRVSAVCFAADGNRAISASFDRTIRVWDLRTGESRTLCSDHASPVQAADVLAGGSVLVSLGEDGKLRFWNLERVAEIPALQREVPDAKALAVARACSQLATGGANHAAKVWRVKGPLAQK